MVPVSGPYMLEGSQHHHLYEDDTLDLLFSGEASLFPEHKGVKNDVIVALDL